MSNFRTDLGTVYGYDWITVPLVYTHVLEHFVYIKMKMWIHSLCNLGCNNSHIYVLHGHFNIRAIWRSGTWLYLYSNLISIFCISSIFILHGLAQSSRSAYQPNWMRWWRLWVRVIGGRVEWYNLNRNVETHTSSKGGYLGSNVLKITCVLLK